MIILIVVVLAGYIYIRENRDAMEKRMEEDLPEFLTKEFADSMLQQAGPGDKATAYQLLQDADMYMETRQYREAGAAYHRAIALYPDGEVYLRYAGYLIEMNKLSMAKETLFLTEALGKKTAQVNYEFARFHGKLKQPYEALEFLRKALHTGDYTVEEIEKERTFDIIRKSVITKQQYSEMIHELR